MKVAVFGTNFSKILKNSIYEDRCEKSQLSPKSMDFETSTVPTRACEVVETSKFDTHGFNTINLQKLKYFLNFFIFSIFFRAKSKIFLQNSIFCVLCDLLDFRRNIFDFTRKKYRKNKNLKNKN